MPYTLFSIVYCILDYLYMLFCTQFEVSVFLHNHSLTATKLLNILTMRKITLALIDERRAMYTFCLKQKHTIPIFAQKVTTE